MKILYMTISYSLEGDGLYQDMVNSLIRRKHKITIVRSCSKIKYTNFEKINDDLEILSVKTEDLFGKNLIKKGINQVMLCSIFKKAIKRYLKEKDYDLILYATPPITLAGVIDYCKKRYQASSFLMLKDIFPQNAVDLEMIKENSIIHKYFKRQEEKYYKLSDYIGCMSQGNADYLLEHNKYIDSKNVLLFPNSIKIEEIPNLSFNKFKTVFILGGNLGKPQNIEFFLELVKELKDYSKAEFIMIGEGTEKQKVIEFVKNEKCSNFKYIPCMPQKEYELLLRTADVGLITLDPKFTIPNIPSRFQTYLKLKKPVLAITDVNTDLKEMIVENKCGWWCNSLEKENILNTIKFICDNKSQQIEKGENGYKYLKDCFDVEDNVTLIEKCLRKK